MDRLTGAPFIAKNGRLCDCMACPTCAPRLLDRLAAHYIPLVLAEPDIYVAITRGDQAASAHDQIRDRISQRARRLVARGGNVDYVRIRANNHQWVFATQPLRGQQPPVRWIRLSRESAAILLDGLLVPGRVDRWPKGTVGWHLAKRKPGGQSSTRLSFGLFTMARSTSSMEAAFDTFEIATGYRPVLGEALRPEDVELLKEIAPAHFGVPDEAGLGDD
jgi:hypothetical protein